MKKGDKELSLFSKKKKQIECNKSQLGRKPDETPDFSWDELKSTQDLLFMCRKL